jgi:hypothetical protein
MIVKGLSTNTLLKYLIKYSFFDWDNEECNRNQLILGIPGGILKRYSVENFYESWGIEAVNNSDANPSFSVADWRKIENIFFDWLKKGAYTLFPDEQFAVTPSLQQDWFSKIPYSYELTKENEWMRIDYEQYERILVKNQIIHPSPNLVEDLRGAFIENYEEFRIIAKMSIRGVPLLFFSSEKMVIYITDCLSIRIYFKDSSIKEEIKFQLTQNLEPQWLT